MAERGRSEVRRYLAAGSVVADGGCVLVLLRPGRDEVRLPKGHVEPGESVQVAAIRETEEESGYSNLSVIADLGEQVVRFRHQGRDVERTEHYFLMTLSGSPQPAAKVGEAQFESRWMEWDRALEALTFEAEREWVRRAREALRHRERVRASRCRATIALSTGSLYTYGIARVFALAAEAGYDGVEVLVDHRWDTRQPVYLRRLADQHALPILALHSPFARDTSGWPGDQLGRLQCTVALALELGTPVVVTHLPFRMGWLSVEWRGRVSYAKYLPVPILRRSDYARFLCDGVGELEEDTGVMIAVENMPAKRFLGHHINPYRFNTLGHLARFPHITLDTTHLGTWGHDPLEAYRLLRGKLAHVHLSNYDGREHRLPWDGRLPLGDLLRQLAAEGFGGTVTVEVEPSALLAEEPARSVEVVREVLAFCRERFQAS